MNDSVAAVLRSWLPITIHRDRSGIHRGHRLGERARVGHGEGRRGAYSRRGIAGRKGMDSGAVFQ